MPVNSDMMISKDWVYLCILMDHFMKDTGKIAYAMAWENWSRTASASMKENGAMTR